MFEPKCYYQTDCMDCGTILRFRENILFSLRKVTKQMFGVDFPLFQLMYI